MIFVSSDDADILHSASNKSPLISPINQRDEVFTFDLRILE